MSYQPHGAARLLRDKALAWPWHVAVLLGKDVQLCIAELVF